MVHPLTKTFTDASVHTDHFFKMCNESPHFIPTQFTYLGNKHLITIKMCKLCYLSKKGTPVRWIFSNEFFQPTHSINISNVDFENEGEICESCLKKQNLIN